MKRVAGVLAWCVLLAASSAYAADAPATAVATTDGTVIAVTVYRGQALVTREVTIPAPGGLREIVVGNLPEQICRGRSTRNRRRAWRCAACCTASGRCRRMCGRACAARRADCATSDQIAANERGRQVTEEQKAYLTKLEQFAAPTANMELTKGVLNAETLKTLTNYVFEQRKLLADQGLSLRSICGA